MDTPHPLTSIIIAAYNEGDNLRRTVDSILANTDGSDYEIVLIDDGGTDTGFTFLDGDPYRSDARLRRFRFDACVGCIRARHQGVRLARGSYILFLDAHMAVLPGWLATLRGALERWGPYAAVTADVAVLDEATWTPQAPTGQFLSIDEKFDFVWVSPPYPMGIVPTAGGACVLMPRHFYYQIGGFDLGLHRWGCEFIDLILKVYAAGGICCYEPSARVGHLFRGAFPYPMEYRDVTYNKLRTGYVHLSAAGFRRLYDQLTGEPGFAEAMENFRADLRELEHLRRAQSAANRRDPDWFAHLFLPGLGELPAPPPPSITPLEGEERPDGREAPAEVGILAGEMSPAEEADAGTEGEPDGPVCPNPRCRRSAAPGHRFCASCGAPLAEIPVPSAVPGEDDSR
jgi:glycosyltransferase involved in cell wall biosynthesis